MNKISHLYHLNAIGYHFTVLPKVYIIAKPHQVSTSYKKTFGAEKVNNN